MLLGREAALQFELSLHNDFKLKPRHLRVNYIAPDSPESKKFEVEQLGVSLSNSRERIVVSYSQCS